MSIVTRKLILTGGRAGKTVLLGKMYRFVDGVLVLRDSASNVEALAHYLAVNYAAYPEGSDELEAINGQHDLPKAEEPDSEHPVLGGVQPGGEGASTEEAPDVEPADGAVEGEADGPVPDGDGHEDSGLHRLQEALDQLDVMEDDHWIADGRPAVTAVEHFLGYKTTRAAIEAVAPDFNREGK